MSLFSLGKTYRGIRRLRRVIQVLFKHGFGHLVERLDLRRYLPLPSKWKPARPPAESIAGSQALAVSAAEALQELGPTFVKLGQFLSTRPDLLPPVYLLEFQKLQDSVEPFSSAEARATIERELGAPLEEFFRDFQGRPVASGSIGQVHFATTAEGEDVVIKVRRPGIAGVIAADLELLAVLAERMEEYIPEARVMQPVMLVDELGRHLRRELDFLHEASSTQKFHDAFQASERFRGPRVHWGLSTDSVLTLERLSGRRISDFTTDGSPDERKRLAEGLFDLYMTQFFKMGFFHADPHPGNLLVDESLCINVIDFGLTGNITDDLRSSLGTAVLALSMRDVDLLAAVMEDLGIFTDTTDFAQVKSDILTLMDTYIGMPLGRVDIPSVFENLTSVAQRNALFLPRDFVMMGKALVTVAGLARSLDADFDAVSALEPYMRTLIRGKVSFRSLKHSFVSMAFHATKLLRHGPADLRRMIRKALSGGLSIDVQHKGLEKLIFDLDRSSNRMAFSIIVASLVIGSSLILRADVGPRVLDMPVVGIGGFILAAVLGLWLVWAILRSGRL